MTEQLNPCKHCRGLPKIVSAPGDLYYAQCTCGKWNPYEFIGTTKQRAAENWNTYNLPKGANNGNKT